MYFKGGNTIQLFRERRRRLRARSTKAEKVLWVDLRNRLCKYKFRRQFSIGRYIVDFYCWDLQLVIELDGPIHDFQKEYDAERQCWLEEQGNFVLRFKNDEVLFGREKVLGKIKEVCDERRDTLTLSLSQRGEGTR